MIPIPDVIPIFPLGEVVLFPDTLLPLHIFEPRYRKMLDDALDRERVIGMTLLTGAARDGLPEVYPIGCAGKIVQNKSLEDGRSLIVLQGTVKFRIREECDSPEPYRSVVPQGLYEAPAPVEALREWAGRLRGDIDALVAATDGDGDGVAELFDKVDLPSMVNYFAASLPFSVLEKQSLLECATVEARFERLSELLTFKATEARLGIDSGRTPDA